MLEARAVNRDTESTKPHALICTTNAHSEGGTPKLGSHISRVS